MNKFVKSGLAAVAIVVSFAALVADATAASVAATKAPGDLGPPRGKLIMTELTSPPHMTAVSPV